MTMGVTIITDDHLRPVRIRHRVVAFWVGRIVRQYGKRLGTITYRFVDDPTILEINKQYLQHDYYTDIITFGDCVEDEVNADIVISLDTVASNAEKYGVTVREEMLRVMAHGVLHLCGFDDETDEQREEMRKAETKAITETLTITIEAASVKTVWR